MGITINNKKISETAWGNIDISSIRNKLIEALENDESGTSAAIRECYAVCQSSDLKNAPSENLKFPHHVLDGDTLILSRQGCYTTYKRLKGAGNQPDITSEEMKKALSHIRGHYVDDLKEDWSEDKTKDETKQAKSYVLHLEPEFDEQLQREYIEYFKQNGIPSKNKQGAVFDLCRSLPKYNKNDLGIRPEVLELSYQTIVHTFGDLNHHQDNVIGSTIKSELIKKENGLNEPIIMRVYAVFWKNRLKNNDIESIAQQNGFSMEALFSDWEFLINDHIYTRQEKPEITEDQVNDLIYNGKPIYDSEGNHVIVLAGTIEKPLEFNGFGVIINDRKPADSESDKTYLEVANQKNEEDEQANKDQNENLNTNKNLKEGELNNMFKEFQTEADWNAAVAEIKSAYKTELQFEKLSDELKVANESLIAKDGEITTLNEKLKTTEATVLSEKERADNAEGELQKIAIAKLVSERKQTLASIGYPEDLITKKSDYLTKATKEEFDGFIDEVKTLFASVNKTFEAKAEKLGLDKTILASVNLTLEDQPNESQDEEKPKTKKLTAF